MILEEATKEAFGYYARDLSHGAERFIIAACELCGEIRLLRRNGYSTFCYRCAQKGGKSFEPYCEKFNDEFKDYIRTKFGYKCFLCPTTQAENDKKLSVHHVNYNKDCGCDGDKTCNFVPLCIRCHTKTNRNREYWQNYITNKLHSTIIGWDG